MNLIWLLLSCVIAQVVCSNEDTIFSSRSLYDLNLPNGKVVNVSTTYVGIAQPVGVEIGVYNGVTGVFVSSFVTNQIHFVDTSSGCEDTDTCTIQTVAGSGSSGIVNGDFETATISDPSRMVYLTEQDVLVVGDRANGLLRYLDMATRHMGTVVTPAGDSVTVVGSAVADNNPELDIKVHGDYFYLSDSRNVYNLTGADGTLGGALTAGVLTPYSALKTWQILNTYDISQQKIFIQTIAVNSKTNTLYVGYTYERSAIIEVPLECNDYSEIRVLSSDNVIYNIPRSFPRPRNGLLNSAPIESYALVTFPMHMVYVEEDDVLYWVEVHSHMSDNKLGAVAVRRLRFTDEGTGINDCDCAELACNCGEIDYYAGDTGTFRSFLGRPIGFLDGFSDKAKFRVPLTISITSDEVGPVIYVADSENSAVRKVHTFVDTESPTSAPTISSQPSLSPTVSHHPTPSPTNLPTDAPTMQPSQAPSRHPMTASSVPSLAPVSSSPTRSPTPVPSNTPSARPTYSRAPTLAGVPSLAPSALNGACLDVVLLDEFGDGWLGAGLAVNHSGFYQPPASDAHSLKPRPKPPPSSKHPRIPHPTDPNAFSSSELRLVTAETNPVQFSVCASLDADRYFERGRYTLEVQSVGGAKIPNEWEMHWQVVMSDGEALLGSSKTSMTFDFNSGGEFKLIQSRALVKERDVCSQCDHPAPKSKPKPKFMRDVSERKLTGSEHHPPPPPRHTVPFVLHSKSGNGWRASSGGLDSVMQGGSSTIGTKYSISDSSKTRLINSGAICEKTLKENCEVKLPDGDYYFRVGGAGDENSGEVAWTFCKVHSNAQSELSFAVVDGQCIPGALRHSDGMSDTIEATTVTMKGEILIENVFEDELSVAAIETLETGIATSLQINKEDVAVVYVCKSLAAASEEFCSQEWGVRDSTTSSAPRTVSANAMTSSVTGMYKDDRKLSETYSFDVVFVVTFIAEKYEVVGTQYQDVMQVSEMLSNSLTEEFQMGSLEVAVRSLATATPHSEALSYVRIVKLVPPVETDLSYKFKAPSQTDWGVTVTDNLVQLSASEVLVIDESLEQESLFFIPLGIVAMAVALVVAVASRQRQVAAIASSERGETGGEDLSWRKAIFGASAGDVGADRCDEGQGEGSTTIALMTQHHHDSAQRVPRNYHDEDGGDSSLSSADSALHPSDRVDYDSMFGSRCPIVGQNDSRREHDSSNENPDLLTNYPADPKHSRSNRFVPPEAVHEGDMAELRGDCEMNVRHGLFSSGELKCGGGSV